MKRSNARSEFLKKTVLLLTGHSALLKNSHREDRDCWSFQIS